MTVAASLAEVNARIAEACARAGRDAVEVTLVAVSKRQPDESLMEAYAAGHRDFGENFVQELERKRALLPDDARWHLIGNVQSNKAKRAAVADVVHTIDSEKLLRRLSDAREGAPLEVLVQVNTEGEDAKSGVAPTGAEALIRAALALPNVAPRGLMCIPPRGVTRAAFAALRALAADLEDRVGAPLPVLSMGMSSDFEAAIEEGATLVRVGTAVFGARQT
ncbi:MAG: YggS family pyridoxal phosphate-dependent enzyme [Deltaproteobacteria bacterium]